MRDVTAIWWAGLDSPKVTELDMFYELTTGNFLRTFYMLLRIVLPAIISKKSFFCNLNLSSILIRLLVNKRCQEVACEGKMVDSNKQHRPKYTDSRWLVDNTSLGSVHWRRVNQAQLIGRQIKKINWIEWFLWWNFVSANMWLNCTKH